MLDEVTDLDRAYAMADIFYLASRLDPLPNVTIDAAMRGLPVICFEGATGIADMLKHDAAAGMTVMPHLDADAAARRIVELANDEKLRKRIGKATRAIARTVFDMDRYVAQLDELGGLAIDSMRQRQADAETIANDPLFDAGFALPADASALTREAAIASFWPVIRPHTQRRVHAPGSTRRSTLSTIRICRRPISIL